MLRRAANIVSIQKLTTYQFRFFADPPPASKKKAKGGDEDVVPPANPSWEFQLRLNEFRVFKDSPMIEEMPDAEYPEWLWSIHIPYPTPNEMSEMSYEFLTPKLKKRYWKINRRAKIKDSNADTTK